MVQPTATEHKTSNAYDLFILVLTVLSLLIMAALLLPLNEATTTLLTKYDNMICVVFLIDFALNLSRSHPKRDYVVGQRGWLDLLGSIPTLGFFELTALFRLARISRLARVTDPIKIPFGRKRTENLVAEFKRVWGKLCALANQRLDPIPQAVSANEIVNTPDIFCMIRPVFTAFAYETQHMAAPAVDQIGQVRCSRPLTDA